ncbi:hypothetical protein SAMN05421856_101157 [Chryseobacterium taichungense]|uniref:Uncharacterized protein n=1 Tax=Chryseobacterium taichungense TaxID=295069 RepID=A0A1H7VQV3_9FLAO|nr:hypothetical protein SAMN05421856_101157 [Chryseobacterium taichungense]
MHLLKIYIVYKDFTLKKPTANTAGWINWIMKNIFCLKPIFNLFVSYNRKINYFSSLIYFIFICRLFCLSLKNRLHVQPVQGKEAFPSKNT